MPDIPQLSLDTLVKLSTHERRVVQESPQVESKHNDEKPSLGICLNLILTLPMDQRQRVMARLLAEAEQWDDAPSMRLVQKPQPDSSE